MNDKIINPVKNISTFSFENFFNVYQDNKTDLIYYNILKNINIIPSNVTEIEDEYIVQTNDTWVYISYKYYNTMDLWWLVCVYNQIQNPTILPEVGEKLKLLKSNYVYSIISELNKQLNK
jgi:hypothetical protein